MKSKTAFKTALISILLFAVLLASAISLSGFNGKTAKADINTLYALSNSSIDITVGEDKVLHVKEKLTLGFRESVSQITRSISVTANSYKNKNGKTVKGGKFLTKVDNVKASIDGREAPVKIDKTSSDYRVVITNPDGDFEIWKKGENDRQYGLELEYDYDLSDDGAGSNALALTVLDISKPAWFYFGGDENNIARLSVTVNMPKPFDKELARVYFGNDDITESTGLDCKGNSLSFSVSVKEVSENTLRIALDKNYFNTHVTYYPIYWLFVGLVAVIILVCIIMTVIYRGRKPVAPVEVEPPVVNPLHYSAYWHGYPQRKDVTTIILYWARLGCIKIEKDGKKDLILTKLKPLPDECQFAERQYFNELFRYGNVFRSKDTRGFKNSGRKDRIKLAVNSLVEESEKPAPFVPQVERTKMFVNILSVVALTIMFVYFIMLNVDIISLTVIPLFLAIMIIPLVKLNSVFSGMNNLKQRNPARFRGISVVMLCGLVPLGLFCWALFYSVYMPQYDYIYMTIVSLIWVLICFFVLPEFIKKRTDEANALYGRMLGFKRFIQLADLPKMELLLKDNPDYFYDVLPYCMVMGLSKKLDRQMQYLNVAVPDWAVGFNPAYFAEELFYSVKHAIIVSRKRGKRKNSAEDELNFK